MPTRAIISDIHGNIEALEAVLEDISARGIGEIYCLGDVVGYGPNPRECLQRVMQRCRVILKGNHEEAILNQDAESFNPRARRAIVWTANQLFSHPADDSDMRLERRSILESLFDNITLDGIRYFHASPRDFTKEYILPGDITNRDKMAGIFDALDTTAFFGHTHIPGVFTPSEYISPDELSGIYVVTGEKALVNVGSVGQPRDGDPRASYVTFDDEGNVVFRRVDYDYGPTISKIYAEKDLDNFEGDRLIQGK
jgi:predicted phosphodiesterase